MFPLSIKYLHLYLWPDAYEKLDEHTSLDLAVVWDFSNIRH